MTRINLISPSDLANDHLLAEYRELPRVFSLVLKRQEMGQVPSNVNIPVQYTLGTGHVTFFYDKCWFLMARWELIVQELVKRNVKVDNELYSNVKKTYLKLNPEWCKSYNPTPADKYLNMARIVNRAKSKLPEIEQELAS